MRVKIAVMVCFVLAVIVSDCCNGGLSISDRDAKNDAANYNVSAVGDTHVRD
jgi:hypothetical protein